MQRIFRLLAIAVLLTIVALTSGCYTIVGYPPEEGVVEEETPQSQVYRRYEYYQDYPYLYRRGYYEPYYSPYYPYYYDYPSWYYRDYYHWDYDDGRAPQKKPETKHRGASELRPESKRRSSTHQEDEEQERSSEEVQRRQRTENRTQKPVRKHRAPTSDSEKP